MARVELPAFFIRGNQSYHTKVFINGISLGDPSLFNLAPSNLQDVNLTQVARIEIIRGTASTLYGNDAIGGVINIITKKNDGKPQGYFNQEIGSFGYTRTAFGISGKAGKLNYNFDLNYTYEDGITVVTTPSQTDRDQYANFNPRLNLAYNFSEDVKLSYYGDYHKAFNDYDNGFSSNPSTQNNTAKRDVFFNRLLLDVKNLKKDFWDLQIGSNFTSFDREPNLTSEQKGKSQTFDVKNTLTFSKQHKIIIGYEYEKINDTTNKRESETSDLYIQNQTSFNDTYFLNLGYRLTDHSKFGDYSSFEIAPAIYFCRKQNASFCQFCYWFSRPNTQSTFCYGVYNWKPKPKTRNFTEF